MFPLWEHSGEHWDPPHAPPLLTPQKLVLKNVHHYVSQWGTCYIVPHFLYILNMMFVICYFSNTNPEN